MTDIWFVHGPPGTGKTTYLSRQAQNAAEKHGPQNIMIASLTRAAASEIAGRDTGIPEEHVGTLHAHCYRALDRPDLAETPEGVRAWNTAHPHQSLSRGVNQLEDTLTDQAGGGEGAGDSVHHQVMTLRASLTPRDTWTLAQRSHDADWEDWKKQTGRLDFTDLIEQCIADGGPHPILPTVLLLDEAQDFSKLELRLAEQWAGKTGRGGTTIIVGDPDQAIYQWRGADPEALLALPYTGERALTQSHRVPATVHHTAMTWIQAVAGRRHTAWQPTPTPGSVRVESVAARAGDQLVPLLEHDLEEGKTVMVLTSCGYMLAPLIQALRAQGVPFHNPYRTNDGRWNPLRGAGRLRAFLRADERVWGDQARCWTWDDLRLWTDPLTARGVMARGAKTFIEAKCQKDRFGESQAYNEVPLDTLFGLFESDAAVMRAIRGDVDWWEQNLRANQRQTAEYPLTVLRRQGHTGISDITGTGPRLCVGTIHSVKGGEADVVYLAPDLSVTGYAGWRTPGQARDQIVRMFYVALTRAREKVTVLGSSGSETVRRELEDALEPAGCTPAQPGEAIAA